MIALLLLLFSGLAHAQAWQDDYRGFQTWEIGLTATVGVGLIAYAAENPAAEPHWLKPGKVDRAAREAFAAGTFQRRERAALASHVLQWSLLAYPLVDAGVVAARGDGEAGGQMALISAQSLLISTLAQRVVSGATGRARPYTLGCAEDASYARHCDSPDRYRSFYSGHTSLSFTGAGLACVQHLKLESYGGAGDAIACGVSLAAATTVGLLRMVSDRHYLSDVLVGAAVGLASGMVLPLAVHFPASHDPAARRSAPTITVRFRL